MQQACVNQILLLFGTLKFRPGLSVFGKPVFQVFSLKFCLLWLLAQKLHTSFLQKEKKNIWKMFDMHSFMGSNNILRQIVTHKKFLPLPFSDQFTIYGMWYKSLEMPTGFMDRIECYMTDKWHTVTQQINYLLNFPCLIFFLCCLILSYLNSQIYHHIKA